jgi:hypothetical protein
VRMFVDEATALVWLKDKSMAMPAPGLAPVSVAPGQQSRGA